MNKEQKQSIFLKQQWSKLVGALVVTGIILGGAFIVLSDGDSSDDIDNIIDDSSNDPTNDPIDNPVNAGTITPEQALDEIMDELYSGNLTGLYEDSIYNVMVKPILDPLGFTNYLINNYSYKQIERTLYYAHLRFDNEEDYVITYIKVDPDDCNIYINHKINEEELYEEIYNATGMNVQDFREFGVERTSSSMYLHMVQLDSHWYWWLP